MNEAPWHLRCNRPPVTSSSTVGWWDLNSDEPGEASFVLPVEGETRYLMSYVCRAATEARIW